MKQVYVDPNKVPSPEEKANYNINREQEALKKSAKSEREKLQSMTFGKRVEYIFSYYRLHIIGIIAALILVIWGINHALTYKSPVFYGCVFDSTFVNDDRAKEVGDYLGLTGHDIVTIQAGVDTEMNPSSGSFFSQLDVFSVAGEIDFVFSDEKGIQAICNYGMALDLTKILPDELYNLWANRIVEFDTYDVSTEDTFYHAPVAVDISGTKVHEYFGLAPNTKYLLIANLSGHDEYMEKFYQMLYEIETGAYTFENAAQ